MIYNKYDLEIYVLTWFSSADMNTKLIVQVSKIDKHRTCQVKIGNNSEELIELLDYCASLN